MRLEDIAVEVRDRTRKRIGVIQPEFLDFNIEVLHNGVGFWECRLPVEHELADTLRTPGGGVIVSAFGEVLASGPAIKPVFSATAADPMGRLTIEGVTDDIHLADALAWPQPSNADVTTQTVSHDERTGRAESLLHAYANANIGPSAPLARRRIQALGTDGGRGLNVTKKARFPQLGALLGEIALTSDLGFQVVQRGSDLTFETYHVTDKTSQIRLDVYNNTLAGAKQSISAPEITRAIVAGQGEMELRTFRSYTNTDATQAEADWDRRIEKFIDQRQTNVEDELKQAGDEALAEKGFTSISVQLVPMDGGTMRFGIDWGLGDRVAAVVDRQEMSAIVTGYQMRADRDGFFLTATIGDPTDFDPDLALRRRVQETDSRLSALERNG